MSRITGLSVLLCTGMMVWATPGYAGFEFTAPAAPAPKQEVAPAMQAEAPMPIVPTGVVTAEPLSAPGAASTSPVSDHVLSMPVSAAASAGEPVYVRRERTTKVVAAPKNEPMDTETLLKATQDVTPVAMTQGKLDDMQAQADGRLLINPYPLDGQASHGGSMGTLPVEQAMMEEGGTLRPVATPGNSSQGLRARAKITSRYDAGDQYLDRAPAQQVPAPVTSSILTPIPGGEGAPLGSIEQMPLAPQQFSNVAPVPASAPLVAARTSVMPRPAIPADYPVAVNTSPSAPRGPEAFNDIKAQPAANGGYTDAVGFGRDLPLALALSQVVPPEYSYAFAQDVNVGSTVSWQGGKPWNQVLDDMLGQSGMKAVIQDNQITIQNANS